MRLAMIGLGRMGGNMSRRLLRSGHEVVVWDRTPARVDELVAEGGVGVSEVAGLRDALASPRVVWLMLPAGDVTGGMIRQVADVLEPGDVIVDGGNAFYRDSMERAGSLAEDGIGFLDAGVSGGVWGLDEGYCIMAGGTAEVFSVVEPALRTLAPAEGYAHVGLSGAGHYVKMIHNGIEYAMMQAIGEGFELLEAADEFSLDLAAISSLWGRGSVVRSWLLELLAQALATDVGLEGLVGYVEDSGEGRWTVEEAVARGVPATAIAHALFARFGSRQDDSFAMKVVAALREQFGGHAVRRSDPE